MDWKELAIRTLRENEDAITYILYDKGATGLEIIDATDYKYVTLDKESSLLFEYSKIVDDGWITIKAYFNYSEADEIIDKIAESIENNPSIKKESWRFSTMDVEDTDWSANWKKYYKAFNVGKKLLVVPEWEKIDNPENRKVVIINPGMAFGTGTHATTKLCMEALEKYTNPDDLVYDIGTGSGILSITACLLGAKRVVGVDIDEYALKVALENILKNNLTDRIELVKGDLLDTLKGKANVIVSNILAEIISTMVPDLKKFIERNGYFISSGLVDEKAYLVRDKLIENGFEIIQDENDSGWTLLVARLSDV